MLSYALAFLAGLLNATGNVLNRKAAREEPDQAEFRLKLITDLMGGAAQIPAGRTTEAFHSS